MSTGHYKIALFVNPRRVFYKERSLRGLLCCHEAVSEQGRQPATDGLPCDKGHLPWGRRGDHRHKLTDEGHEQQDRSLPVERHSRDLQNHGQPAAGTDREVHQAGCRGQVCGCFLRVSGLRPAAAGHQHRHRQAVDQRGAGGRPEQTQHGSVPRGGSPARASPERPPRHQQARVQPHPFQRALAACAVPSREIRQRGHRRIAGWERRRGEAVLRFP
mmetsp:Transcript_5579/g.13578  ORF Transcript_5579/g.13578 Transcript_5579/m.13578 type:complete len:216 (+) Transcript_5579:403-1050(+)